MAEDDLPKIQEEVNQLQAQFDGAVVEKHSLEIELVSMNERLKAATEMLDRYWTRPSDQNSVHLAFFQICCDISKLTNINFSTIHQLKP